MKLDATVMRTMEKSDFRVLEAVEKGMKDHAIVPLHLINLLAGLRHGGSHKITSSLLRDKLLSHETKGGCDGYRLTNAGYDILAMGNLKSRGIIAAMGQRIGTGKESDIYLAASPDGTQIVLKFHRLGRTSFRNVRKKRDYFNNASKNEQTAHSWLFLSRLSALKEFAFMKALYDVKYPTPTPIAHNRHIIAMSLVRGIPLYQVFPKQLSVAQAADIYHQAVGMAVRLAKQHGLVHCDLNEFNLLVDLSGIQSLATDDGQDPYVRHSGTSVAPDMSVGALSKPAWEQTLEEEHIVSSREPLPEPVALLPTGEPKPVVTLIDFPQMISTKHPNAEELYDRDIACMRRFFEQKLQCHIPDDDPVTNMSHWDLVTAADTAETENRLDEDLRASGFSDAYNGNQDLELYYFRSGPQPIQTAVEEEEESDDDDDSNDEDDDPEDKSNEDAPETKSLDGFDDDEEDSKVDLNEKIESLSLLDTAQLQSMTREKLTEIAKERVAKQLDEQRRKSRQKGAFRKRNTNKSYVKGKRVMTDALA